MAIKKINYSGNSKVIKRLCEVVNGLIDRGSITSLAELTDVDLDNLTNEQIIKYNSTSEKWENADESGGGGSIVVVTPIVTSGTKIATITVDGVNYDLYAPEGGGDVTEYGYLAFTPSYYSNTLIYGNEITPTEDIIITGLRGLTQSSKTGSLRIGTTSAIIQTINNISFAAGIWTEAQLPTPLILTAGTTYIVQVVIDSGQGQIGYTQNSGSVSINSKISNIGKSRYGGFPGTQESNVWVGADVMIKPSSKEYGYVSYSARYNSNSLIHGNEITPNENITIRGLRGYVTVGKTGSLRIGTTSSVIQTIDNVSFTANAWTEANFESPMTLTAGTTYIVQVVIPNGSTGNIGYTETSGDVSINSKVSNPGRGRWGGFPGTLANNTWAGADIIIDV